RPRRPNYARIHAKALPLEVHPLSVFIPHNPISLVRIAIQLISHSIWPPSSHQTSHQAYFSPETQSVHVTDWESVRALWEHGFFGAGNLSRTEPQWLDYEKKRRGVGKERTAHEVTQSRREERHQFKLERARKEREMIEQQRQEEGKLETSKETVEAAVPLANGDAHPSKAANGVPRTPDSKNARRVSFNEPLSPQQTRDSLGSLPEEIENQEHLQLTLEEAFFLTYVLGVLQVFKSGGRTALSCSELFRIFCAFSTDSASDEAAAVLGAIKPFQRTVGRRFSFSGVPAIAPDNPFILRYAVYHHFRSLGWVVRDGVKFAADYLLYHRGPVFKHAEFAIMIMPSYSDQYWSANSKRKAEYKKKEGRDWWWFHRVNRVQTQAIKTLMLVYVEVPPPWDEGHDKLGYDVNAGAVLKKYKVREVVMQRWTPNRHR
ncbi:hypothetical protein BDV96DRAFT_474184, partial [Lophiotrema nucula]